MSGPVRVLVTGSRTWDAPHLLEAAPLDAWHDATQLDAPGILLVHGGCPNGADAQADHWVRTNGVPVEVWPAEWAQHGRAAGMVRNAAMVRAGADLVLGFVRAGSRGASHCLRAAVAAGLPVRRWDRP